MMEIYHSTIEKQMGENDEDRLTYDINVLKMVKFSSQSDIDNIDK